MTHDFDPYYEWLAIPPAEQPPDFYRLLHVQPFEQDRDVIHSAADRQMAHVRTFQSGARGGYTQPLLNEIAKARVTLTDPARKTQYDRELRTRAAAAGKAAAEVALPAAPMPVLPAVEPTLPAPEYSSQVVATAELAPLAPLAKDDLLSADLGPQQYGWQPKGYPPPDWTAANQPRQIPLAVWLAAAGGVGVLFLLALVAIAALAMMLRSPSPESVAQSAPVVETPSPTDPPAPPSPAPVEDPKSAVSPSPSSPSTSPPSPATSPTPESESPSPSFPSPSSVPTNPTPAPPTPATPVAPAAPPARPLSPQTWRLLLRTPKVSWGIKSLAFSPDGKRLAYGTLDCILGVIDLENRKLAAEIQVPKNLSTLSCIAYSPDGNRLLAAGSTGGVYVFDAGGRKLAPVGFSSVHKREIECMRVTEDNRYVLSGDTFKELKCWSLADGLLKWTVADFSGKVLAVTDDGENVLATDGRALLRIELESGKVVERGDFSRTDRGYFGGAQSAAFSADGRRVACCDGYTIRSWDVPTAKPLPACKTDAIQWAMAFLPDGRRVLAGGTEKMLLVDTETGNVLSTLPLGSNYCMTVACSPDGRRVAGIGEVQRVVSVYEAIGDAAGGSEAPPPADVADEAIHITNPGRAFFGPKESVIGWEFQTSAKIRLTHLGVFGKNRTSDGLAETHPVALWEDGNPSAPLAATVIPAGTEADVKNHVRYLPVTPVDLEPGKTYVIGALYVTNDDMCIREGSSQSFAATFSDLITIGAYRRSNNATRLSYPTITIPSPAGTRRVAIGPTFLFVSP